MILKVGRKSISKDKKVEVITEYFQSGEFTVNGDTVMDGDRNLISIGNVSDQESGVQRETLFVYLMNDEGKTIERLK